jgi:glycosyltransferase involved in cell wall biosynthesis
MALRVGLLHYTAPPVVGGVETVLGEHALLLAAAGHEVRIIAGNGARAGRRIEAIHIPLASTRHPVIRGQRTALDAGRVPASFTGVLDELARSLGSATAGLDLLIAHNVCSLHFNLALTAALRRLVDSGASPPLIAWHHDLSVTSARWALQLHPGAPWSLVREAWPGVTHVAVSEARRDEIARAFAIPPGAIRVVPNGIDLAAAQGLGAATRRLLSPLRLPARGAVVLVPTRLTRRKNLELAIRVLSRLREGGADARLLLTAATDPHDAGAAAYRADLRALASELGVDEAVHFLTGHPGGRLPPSVVSDLYRVADLLLLPSRDEGFGLPVLEAGASRLPVVCADLPSLRGLAGEEASYFDPDAPDAEVAALVRSRLEREPASRLAARVRAEYGWARIYETAIEPLLFEVAGALRAGDMVGERPRRQLR